MNNTNQTLIAEVDFGHIALIDSFGRRFGDWDGGGLYAVRLEAGQAVTFDRHYSDISGRHSRITRGAEVVLLTFDNVAGIPTGTWKLDIVR